MSCVLLFVFTKTSLTSGLVTVVAVRRKPFGVRTLSVLSPWRDAEARGSATRTGGGPGRNVSRVFQDHFNRYTPWKNRYVDEKMALWMTMFPHKQVVFHFHDYFRV